MKIFDKVKNILSGDRLVAVAFILILLPYWYQSLSMTASLESDVVGPDLFPKLIAVFGIILSIILFIGTSFSKVTGGKIQKERKESFENITPLFFLLIYALSIEKIGFPVGTFLFLSLTFKFLGYQDGLDLLLIVRP